MTKYVLYWAQANRRADSNRALAHAVDLANGRMLPVLFYEHWKPVNDRLDAFVLDGAADTGARLRDLGIGYEFHNDDVLERLSANAAALVTDDHPFAVKPRVPHTAVDSSCIVPMRHFEKREYAAYTIRGKIHKLLPQYLQPILAMKVKVKWTGAAGVLPGVFPGAQRSSTRGGTVEARRRLDYFLEHNLRRYARLKNEPSARATSSLSAYLHFGHISSLEVALAVRDYAAEYKLVADEFLEELIVRRELAFNFARFTSNPASFDDLPEWARKTLSDHARDKRNRLYTRDDFIGAETHDPLWNATQKEMLRTGKIHGYYRMYWGKKILEWSRTPEEAVNTMVHIHDNWALDGRDPNTYANILWCLGLHDRPWPERPVFGKVRYMSYDGMKRKTDVDAYISQVEEL